MSDKTIQLERFDELLQILMKRFEENKERHPDLKWCDIKKKLENNTNDKRYGRTFIYHNGAESYYASRGFRGLLKI